MNYKSIAPSVQSYLGNGTKDKSKIEHCGKEIEESRNIFCVNEDSKICNVWEDNLEKEIGKISDLIDNYNIISIDTEFPGAPISISASHDDRDYEYKLIRENVNALKVIQIGISLANEFGDIPFPCNTWQFNFDSDHSSGISISLLKDAGIDFEKLKKKGINPLKFAELMICSGIVLNENVKWIAFHGGFDFGYFLKTLTNSNLPGDYNAFSVICQLYFQNIYDLKYLVNGYSQFKSLGLSKLAGDLGVKRIGENHQAGSDSLLTLQVYFKFIVKFVESEEILEEINGVIYGIGKGYCDNRDYLQNYFTEFDQYFPTDNFAFNDMAMNYYGSSSHYMQYPYHVFNSFNYVGVDNTMFENNQKFDLFQM